MIIREVVTTADGSVTLYMPDMDEHYHSVNGAIGESEHVFLKAGFDHCTRNPVIVFEAGFGTGLNALLTAIRSGKQKRLTTYITIEKYPLPDELISQLNYPKILGENSDQLFRQIHSADWETTVMISEYFEIKKIKGDLLAEKYNTNADIIYFDAFAHSKQPDLWGMEVLERTCSLLGSGGIFVTYSARGELKRNLKELGLEISLLPGAAGKREMIRAIKK
jgi:tRNA U34 5-methylaminomethyl-2-thiouridine-forming methyltransferase MnmC